MGVFFVPNKKKTNEIKGLFGTPRYMLYLPKVFFEEDTEEDKGNFMIVCSKYRKWYHKKCEKVHTQFSKMKKVILWKCATCK